MLIEIVAYEYMDVIRKVWRKTLEIFFPVICISCSKYLPPEENENLLCQECFNSIEILEEDPKTQVHSIGLYSSKPLRDLIHGLKFKRFTRAIDQIGDLVEKYLEKNPHSVLKTCNLVTFIPLHPMREKHRGFNQAELIAKVLENHLNTPLQPLLKRARQTKEQYSIKDFSTRAKNVQGCFKLLGNTSLDRKILLVDDVYTSGSTATEAIQMLRTVNSESIIVFVLARTR